MEEKKTNSPAPAPATELESAKTVVKIPKALEYVGPKPAPVIGNLPINPKLPRLGTLSRTYHADELPEQYIEYVRATNPQTQNWWK